MPTATTTLTAAQLDSTVSGTLSLKSAAPAMATPISNAETLRSLYPRAAKAFVKRDFAFTFSLVTTAFGLLGAPAPALPDELSSHRRKWDILRITLETTVYASPPASEDPAAFPAPLRANQLQSPQSLLTTLHARSLQLFTPTSQKANAAFLPYQILVTLVSASLKLGCGDVGRAIIEDWLARRVPDGSDESHRGYAKVLELYCLHVLPRLEEWQYAEDFLQYERELDVESRNHMVSALQRLHSDVTESRSLVRTPPQTLESPQSSASSSRSVSPSPSISSESSCSTHTATPRTPHPEHSKAKGKGKDKGKGTLNGLTRMTPTSSSAQSVASNATVKPLASQSTDKSRTPTRRDLPNTLRRSSTPNGQPIASTSSSISRAPRSTPIPSSALEPPSTTSLIRAYIKSILRNASKPKLFVYFVLFVVFPFVSFFMRFKRRKLITGNATGGAAEEVRRRLRGARPGSANAVGRLWNELSRSVIDTIRMGGGGLA